MVIETIASGAAAFCRRTLVAGAVGVALAGAAAAQVGSPLTDPMTAQGKELYETIGGIGCAACHGYDASGEIGPNIRGADVGKIHVALTNITDMNFLTGLTTEDIEALSSYLLFLNQH